MNDDEREKEGKIVKIIKTLTPEQKKAFKGIFSLGYIYGRVEQTLKEEMDYCEEWEIDEVFDEYFDFRESYRKFLKLLS